MGNVPSSLRKWSGCQGCNLFGPGRRQFNYNDSFFDSFLGTKANESLCTRQNVLPPITTGTLIWTMLSGGGRSKLIRRLMGRMVLTMPAKAV